MAITPLSQTEAADRLRISTSWLRVLTDRGEVTRNEDGTYPWPTVGEEYEAYQNEVGAGQGSGSKDEYDKWRTRKVMVDAQIKEDELAVRRGDLVPADEVLARIRKPLEEVDGRLRSAPRRLAKEWAPRIGKTQAEAIALIGELTEEIRADLRRVFEEE